MLVAAALIPETALLVPGAAGAADVLADEREAALVAVRDLIAHRPDRVVVVTARNHRAQVDLADPLVVELVGHDLSPTLAAAGIADATLAWTPSGRRTGTVVVQEVGASVALLLLDQVGWDAPVDVVTVATRDAPALHDLGARLVEDASTALLLVGSLSARRGPDAPLPEDDRAGPFDTSVLADLGDLGPVAAARLAAVPAELAVDLAVSSWAPWQVLLGAVDEPLRAGTAVRAEIRSVSAPYGATYAVLLWGVT